VRSLDKLIQQDLETYILQARQIVWSAFKTSLNLSRTSQVADSHLHHQQTIQKYSFSRIQLPCLSVSRTGSFGSARPRLIKGYRGVVSRRWIICTVWPPSWRHPLHARMCPSSVLFARSPTTQSGNISWRFTLRTSTNCYSPSTSTYGSSPTLNERKWRRRSSLEIGLVKLVRHWGNRGEESGQADDVILPYLKLCLIM
jgi:hypothetical protein